MPIVNKHIKFLTTRIVGACKSAYLKGVCPNLSTNYTELVSKSESLNIQDLQVQVFHDQKILNMFEDYRKIYEERENINLGAHFEVDKSALNVPRKLRKIKLDDTVELCLMKTGNFIERGFDENRGRSYYKIYYSKEK